MGWSAPPRHAGWVTLPVFNLNRRPPSGLSATCARTDLPGCACAVLELTVDPDVTPVEQDGVPLIAVDLVEVVPAREGLSDPKMTQNGPSGGPGSSSSSGRLILAPLERLAVPHALSGADGENRSTAFCCIQVQHDLDAVRAYLNRYRDQPKALRAYTKELERFLLWAVVLRGKAEGHARGIAAVDLGE
jgi:hypothetical protein